MSTIKHFTTGQKEALLVSLEGQKSPKTPSERKVLNELREFFSESVDGEPELMRCGDFIKFRHMDTFGDRWNNNWIKIYSTDKGEYFKMHYLGNKRIYLN
jgi:hypothetical protein